MSLRGAVRGRATMRDRIRGNYTCATPADNAPWPIPAATSLVMLKDFSVQALFMGVLTAFVGFASSFAVVLHGLQAVGATEAQAASGLMALSIAMGLCAIVLSLLTRLPVSIAWSTPGAALLASTGAIAGGYQ